MEVNKEGVVAEELPLFLLSHARGIEVAGLLDVLVRQDRGGLAMNVAGRFKVVNCQVVCTLVFVNLEEEVLPRDDLLVGCVCEGLLRKLVFEVLFCQFALNNLIDLLLHL